MDEARAIQIQIWRACGGSRRIEIASELMAVTRAIRDARLRRQFPEASEQQLGWARVREALGLPAGLTPP